MKLKANYTQEIIQDLDSSYGIMHNYPIWIENLINRLISILPYNTQNNIRRKIKMQSLNDILADELRDAIDQEILMSIREESK